MRSGATVGAAYISGILGTGGALMGVVKVLLVPLALNEGIDFFILLSIQSKIREVLECLGWRYAAGGAKCFCCSEVCICIR